MSRIEQKQVQSKPDLSISQASVLVVMPTYREAANITVAIEAVRSASGSPEILIVDDEGGDGTADLAEKVGARLGGTHLLRRKDKGGLASAYKEGFTWGLERGYEVLVGMDADLSHDANALPRLLAALSEGADVAIGSRYVPGGSTVGWPLSRRVMSRAGNWYAKHLLGAGPSDLTSAFRAYRAESLRKLDFDVLMAEGYGFLIELVYRLERAGALMAEVPIRFADRRSGRSKMSPAIAMESFKVVTKIGLSGFTSRFSARG